MGATKQTLNRASTYFPFKMALESFDNIYLDLSKESGKCRFAENGFGWKPSGGGDTFTLDHSNIGGAQWSRAAKGYEVKILLRNSGVVQLDGFSQEDFRSHHQQSGIKCSIKASEGFLYCLEKAFMFVPKPATYIQFDQIEYIVLSRVGGAVSASRTFDITVQMKGSVAESQFSNINREEQKPLEDFFKIKGLRVKNEMDEDSESAD